MVENKPMKIVLGICFITILVLNFVAFLAWSIFHLRLQWKYRDVWIALGKPKVYKNSPFDKTDVEKGQRILNQYLDNKEYFKLNDKLMDYSAATMKIFEKMIGLGWWFFGVLIIVAIVVEWRFLSPE